MPNEMHWQYDLEEYIKQGELDRAERSAAWQTAIGLQAVDGLTTSAYLLEAAKDHIEGKTDISGVHRRLQSYYEERQDRKSAEADTMEADLVSVRITELLGEKAFQFSPAAWQAIHRRLFSDIFDFAGQIRTYNITKKEWILKGNTVLYASCDSINETLAYDFGMEKQFSYKGLSDLETVRHIAKFTSDIWQIHPFCEGNTRATAVFIIKYLKSLGFSVSNDVFAENSWYFRNALVRANYNDFRNGIYATTKYLEWFFENLLMGQHHDLKNRFLHIDFQNALENGVTEQRYWITLEEQGSCAGSTGKLRNMSSVYLRQNGRVLLLYRQGSRVVNDVWVGSAGGHFEAGELNDARACVLRELEEELAVTEDMLRNMELRYITLRRTKGDIRQNYYFFADLKEGAQKNLTSNEGPLEWFSADQLPELEMPFTARYVMDHYLELGRHDHKLYGGIADGERVVFTELPEF